MSAPPDALMKLMAGGGGGATQAPNPAAAAPGNAAPAGGPMTTPQPKEGLVQAAMIDVSMAMNMLEKSLPAFGSTSDQGAAVLSALKSLSGTFGKERAKADQFGNAELMQLMAQAPAQKAMGAMPPGQPAIPAGAPA